MRKTVIILSVFALIASSCRQANNAIETNRGESSPCCVDSCGQTNNAIETNQENEQRIITQKAYFLDEIKVLLTQQKSNGIDYYCKAKLIVAKNGRVIDSIGFTPEPLGGNYGISNAIKIGNHLIFTKHGDYDGRTIIINNKGKMFNIIGGQNYVDVESNLLFAIYESDISGFAIFDLKSDTILLTMDEIDEYPVSIQKTDSKYFIVCESDEMEKKSFWEFDLKMKKVKKSGFDIKTMNNSHELQRLLTNDVNCICEE